jgi:hypothetical protein
VIGWKENVAFVLPHSKKHGILQKGGILDQKVAFSKCHVPFPTYTKNFRIRNEFTGFL